MLDNTLRRLYQGGRPHRFAKLLNRGWAAVAATGVVPRSVALEVEGRRSHQTIRLPLVIADHNGQRYLVAMLGRNTQWLRNVRAADGRAVLVHGIREAVRLEEVYAGECGPIIRRYLQCAPGARPHIPVGLRAADEAFDRIAPDFPVLRVVTDDPEPAD